MARLLFWFLLTFPLLSSAIRILPNSRGNVTSSDERRRQALSTPMNVNVPVPTSPDDHLVGQLPLASDELSMTNWAGHLPASGDKTRYFFYWLFAPNVDDNEDVPLLIWLNGGPACSSMDGLFIENGPIRLTLDENNNYRITEAPYSWHKAPAYTLYIDQPVGTGLSFTTTHTYPTNDLEVNVDFHYFLQEFFQLHSDKFVTQNKVNRKVFFSGESHAGHYIPSMMNYILQQNGKAKIDIPLAGGAIGNGWVDPFYQYPGADFAYGNTLIGLAQVEALKEQEKECQNKINQGKYASAICFNLIDDIIRQSHGASATTKVSQYDIRLTESKTGLRDFPKGHKVVETYLGGWALPPNDSGNLDKAIYRQVLEAIHASSAIDAKQRYRECTDPPYEALSGQDGLGVVDDVVAVLEHPDNVRLLFFNGVFDIVCNHVGNERFLQHLPWAHKDEWTVADRYAWFSKSGKPGKADGYMQEFKNLLFLKMMDSGHMVPMDVPDVALDMMKVFMYDGSFDGSKQNLERSTEKTECQVCPTCRSRDSGAVTPSEAPAEDTGSLGTFVISYAWLVAAVGVMGLVVFTMVWRQGRSGRPVVPSYELELRESSQYRDSVDSQDDEHRVL